jgi:predicted nucleic acid-binding protein
VNSYYLGASVLVKRYVDEVGSDWLRTSVIHPSSPLLFTSRMAIVEVVSAFARRVREGSLTSEEFTAARDAFRGDCLNEYQIMPPTVAIIDQACNLLERLSLRAYDATHLATALSAAEFLARNDYPTLIFLASDDRLNNAATIEGLAVDNPNRHP